jgi:hypothetical protein
MNDARCRPPALTGGATRELPRPTGPRPTAATWWTAEVGGERLRWKRPGTDAYEPQYEPLVVPVAWVDGRASVQAHVNGEDLGLADRFTAVLEHRTLGACSCRRISRSLPPAGRGSIL